MLIAYPYMKHMNMFDVNAEIALERLTYHGPKQIHAQMRHDHKRNHPYGNSKRKRPIPKHVVMIMNE